MPDPIVDRIADILRPEYYRILNSSTDVRTDPGRVLAAAVVDKLGLREFSGGAAHRNPDLEEYWYATDIYFREWD